MNTYELSEEDVKGIAFWGTAWESVKAARQGTQQVVKSKITAEDIAVFETERARIAAEQAKKNTHYAKTGYSMCRGYGKHWGTCWECGCDGWVDSDDYCGC